MASQNVLVTKTVANLLKNLSQRNRDIISRRFGLKTGKKETLESIGKNYGITRERVRQIEEFSLAQLSKASNSISEVSKYVSKAREILNNKGGLIKESELFKAFSGNDKESVANASLVFILTLVGEPVRFNENELFYSFWAINKETANSLKEAASSLTNAFNKGKKLVDRGGFNDFAKESGLGGLKDPSVLLTVCKNLDVNVFGQIGLASWAEVKPKGVRDKAYLVLKKEGTPKHFTEIAKLINNIGFSNKRANTQTVHNELIKDLRFVLVGRGLYGLSEWGYNSGTVKEVLVDILKNSSEPMHKAELVAKVLDARMVKENTILLNLQDSKVFSKREDGKYALRKA